MKNTMPRLVDDNRRDKLVGAGIIAAALLVSAFFAYNAWMRPYRVRRAKIGAVIREGAAAWEKLHADIANGDGSHSFGELNGLNDLSALGAGLREITVPNVVPDRYETSDKDRALRLSKELAEAAEAVRLAIHDFAAATNRAGSLQSQYRALAETPGNDAAVTAESNLEQCLMELRTLHGRPRPDARSTGAAMDRFKSAYASAMSARAALTECVERGRTILSNAEIVADAARKAAKRAEEAAKKAVDLEKEVGTLRIDRTKEVAMIQKFAEKLEGIANQTRKDVAAIWESAQGASANAVAALETTGKILDAAEETMRSLLEKHGAFVADAPRTSLLSARNDFGGKKKDILSKIEEWTDVGRHGVTRTELLNAADEAEAQAKKLREGIADLTSVSVDTGIIESVAAFRNAAGIFVSDMRNTHGEVDRFAEKAKEAVSTAEDGLPNWADKTAALNDEIGRIVQRVDAAKTEVHDALGRLDSYQSEGDRKQKLLRALAGARNDLEALKVPDPFPTAENGRDYTGKAQECQTFSNTASAAIEAGEGVMAEFKRAAEEGELFKIVCKVGAEIWSEALWGGDFAKRGLAPVTGKSMLNLGESVKACGLRSNAPLGQFGWKFSIKVPKSGQHVLQVLLTTARGALINTSTKGKRFKGGVRDGRIVINYGIESAKAAFKDRDSQPFQNGQFLSRRVIYSRDLVLKEGDLDLSFVLDSIQLDTGDKDLPEADTSWNYDPITFTITLDGNEVEPYHVEREK